MKFDKTIGCLFIGMGLTLFAFVLLISGFSMGEDSVVSDCKALGRTHTNHAVLVCSLEPETKP